MPNKENYKNNGIDIMDDKNIIDNFTVKEKEKKINDLDIIDLI